MRAWRSTVLVVLPFAAAAILVALLSAVLAAPR
jgi:hypothetical protein